MSQQPVYPYTPKSKGNALILEILPFFFGIMGIGWIYAGNTTAGILILIGYLFWNVMAVTLDVLTVGICLCVHVPANIAFVALSAIMLNNHAKQHPEIFGV